MAVGMTVRSGFVWVWSCIHSEWSCAVFQFSIGPLDENVLGRVVEKKTYLGVYCASLLMPLFLRPVFTNIMPLLWGYGVAHAPSARLCLAASRASFALFWLLPPVPAGNLWSAVHSSNYS